MTTDTRIDALPEGTQYEDTGCDLAPHCLECPFPTCLRGLERAVESHRRRGMVLFLRHQLGLNVEQIAAITKISSRQCHRFIRETKLPYRPLQLDSRWFGTPGARRHATRQSWGAGLPRLTV